MFLDKEIEAIPKEDLYWEKVKLEDEEFRVHRRMQHVKSTCKRENYIEQTREIVDRIRRIEQRMGILNL